MSPSPSKTLSPPPTTIGTTVFDAIIEQGAVTATDEVWVLLPDFDGGKHRHGPVRWSPEVRLSGIYYPKTGQVGVAIRAKETGELWLTQFTPTGEPDAMVGESEGVGTPYYIPAGETFLVPINEQVLYAAAIEVDGTLEIDGKLIEVN